MHDLDFDQYSGEWEESVSQRAWNPDLMELTSVGIDIGSSTSHLMFSRLDPLRDFHLSFPRQQIDHPHFSKVETNRVVRLAHRRCFDLFFFLFPLRFFLGRLHALLLRGD